MGNLFILISVLFNVSGQAVLKSGVNKLGGLNFDVSSIMKAFTSPLVLAGLFAYLCGSVFWILALSRQDLSYAYPMLSIGYLLVLFVSFFVLDETINLYRLTGVILITLGVFFVFKSA